MRTNRNVTVVFFQSIERVRRAPRVFVPLNGCDLPRCQREGESNTSPSLHPRMWFECKQRTHHA